MSQAHTLETTLTDDRKVRIGIERMQEYLLERWERIGKVLFSRADARKADYTPGATPLSGYYAGAYDRVRASEPVVSLRHIERVARGPHC
jgi:hypothetical protein